MKFIASWLATTMLFCSAMGCGDGKLDTVPISGTVKLNGEPLSSTGYALRFENERDLTSATNVEIKSDGTFQGEAAPGSAKVYLTGYTPSGEESSGSHGENSAHDDGSGEITEPAPQKIEVKSDEVYELNFEI